MYELTGLFFYKLQFMCELLIAQYMFLARADKRNHFWIRVSVGIILCLGFSLALPVVSYSSWWMIIMFVLMFSFTIIVHYFCFDISLFKIFFFSSAGYLTQHMSYALDNFILIIGNIDTSALSNGYGSEPVKMMNIMSWVVYLDSYIAIYLIVYLVFCTRIQGNDFYISKMWTFVLCTIFMFSAIILNSFVVRTYDVKQNKIFIIISLLYSFSSSFISLLFYFQLKDTKKMEHDKNVIKHMWKEDREHYQMSKENIDIINSKCHDLKHQIRKIGTNQVIDPHYIKQIEDSISIYDSVIKTGCLPLDVVLTEKSLICKQKNINLTYMIDGSKLLFMEESDIYSIFGNALDNAIEYLTKDVKEDRRFIRISSFCDKGLFIIHIENYFEGTLKIADGLPSTTKNDKTIHGYGLKSMKMICESYNCEMLVNTGNNMFSIDITFPLNEEKVNSMLLNNEIKA